MNAKQILGTTVSVVLISTGFSRAAWFDDFEDTTSLATHYKQADTTTSPTNRMFINVGSAMGTTVGQNSIKANKNNTLTYTGATFGLPAGYQITTSILVAQRTANEAGGVLVQLGFGNTDTDTFSNGPDTRAIYSRLFSNNTDNNNTQYRLASDNKFSASAASENVEQPTVRLTGGFGPPNNNSPVWYLYSVTITRSADQPNTFTAYSRLQAVGPTGTETPGDVLISYTGTYTNADFASLADQGLLYAAIRSNTDAGALRLDNFHVTDPTPVPEPAVSAVLFGAAGLLLGKRRKNVR